MRNNWNKYFNQGRADFEAGERRTSNPYDEAEIAHEAWEKGWDEASQTRWSRMVYQQWGENLARYYAGQKAYQ